MSLNSVAAVVPAVAAAVAYLEAARRLWRRGDWWAWRWTLAWVCGCLLIPSAVWVEPPVGEFTAHMAQHVAIGMIVPLLLVLGRPVTLALRALPPGRRRRALLGVVGSRPVAWVLVPPVAALIDVGGLWVLYRTGLFAAAEDRTWLHAAVHVHVLVAGTLFTASLVQVDPFRRRHGLAARAAALVGASAGHAVLAKTIYAAGVPALPAMWPDVHLGAQVMYYGGDVVEIGLVTALALQWYAAQGRALQRRRPAGMRWPAQQTFTADGGDAI
jgi:putative membrane protein